MIILGVLFIACLVTFFGAVMSSDGIVFPGYMAATSFFVMAAVGLALAVHAL